MSLKIVFACTLALLSSLLHAAGAPPGMWQFSIGGLSYHMPHDKPYNEVNYGLGIEYQWASDTAFKGGVYKNSFGRTSKYVFTQYHPFEFADLRLGATMGFVDGYPAANKGNFNFVVLPSFSRQWKHIGINGIVVPPIGKKEGVIFIEFKIPFDELKALGR